MKPRPSRATRGPATRAIKIVWTGTCWQCKFPAATRGIAAGTRFVARIPAGGRKPSRPPARGRQRGDTLMFPAGTVLFMLLKPMRNEVELHRISQEWWNRDRFLKTRPDKDLVPIRLLDDLRLENLTDPQPKNAPCACTVEGLDGEYPSLNAAATAALKRWTVRRSGKYTCNVFDEVKFVHEKQLLPLGQRRGNVRHKIDLPVALPETEALPGF